MSEKCKYQGAQVIDLGAIFLIITILNSNPKQRMKRFDIVRGKEYN